MWLFQSATFLTSNLPHCRITVQITRSSIVKSAWLLFCVMEWESPSILSCTLSKSVCILSKINIHVFIHFLFFYVFLTTLSLSSWNQIGLLHWKWISRFTTVSSVPINHEHSDSYCCSTVCNLFHDAVCISIYDTNNSVIENKTQGIGQ